MRAHVCCEGSLEESVCLEPVDIWVLVWKALSESFRILKIFRGSFKGFE